ncbi:PadR family transcriptional regulator [Fictibacillus sp. 5RED26]|uniref:PadR family transcriptional regulator n=1 Tax=Fictibacillus sp. 5RED26 TaxID=2745876 RepID=UPI0018CEAD99|nr:PadR family transcriptional regulator [Fictibacillus sp. 5RED26]MBH0155172.1 PadR family transcriptional regulator [Fictibacillus sp. 5RED26]
MENRLKNLKKIMDEKTFSHVRFTEKHRETVQNKWSNQEDKEQIVLNILQLLNEEKTGYQLANLLLARGVKQFDDNEGSLYVLLHSLESKGVVQSEWLLKEKTKYYHLTHKGKRLLKQAEHKEKQSSVILQQLIGGAEWKIAESRF